MATSTTDSKFKGIVKICVAIIGGISTIVTAFLGSRLLYESWHHSAPAPNAVSGTNYSVSTPNPDFDKLVRLITPMAISMNRIVGNLDQLKDTQYQKEVVTQRPNQEASSQFVALNRRVDGLYNSVQYMHRLRRSDSIRHEQDSIRIADEHDKRVTAEEHLRHSRDSTRTLTGQLAGVQQKLDLVTARLNNIEGSQAWQEGERLEHEANRLHVGFHWSYNKAVKLNASGLAFMRAYNLGYKIEESRTRAVNNLDGADKLDNDGRKWEVLPR